MTLYTLQTSDEESLDLRGPKAQAQDAHQGFSSRWRSCNIIVIVTVIIIPCIIVLWFSNN